MTASQSDPSSRPARTTATARQGNGRDIMVADRQYTTPSGASECWDGAKRETGTGNDGWGNGWVWGIAPRSSNALRRIALPCALVLLAVIAAGCQTLPAGAAPAATAPAAAATAAPDPALQAQQDRFIAAATARDAAALTGLFAEDAVLHVAGRPPVQGRDAIRQFYGAVFGFMSGSSMTPELLHASAGGDMAWGAGATVNEFRGPDGVMRYTGKYLLVWRRTAGEWQVAAYAISSDEPQGD